jgi:phosphatidylglycerophosphatase A
VIVTGRSAKPLDFLIKFLSSGFYAGYVKHLPGTAGTMVGILIYFLMPQNPYWYGVWIVILALAGIWISGKAEEIYNKKDDQRIVIDEITGYLLSMFLLPGKMATILTAFVIFRFFDWIKPYPINRAERLRGGLGIMADDIIAGICTCLCLHLARLLWVW